MRFLCQNCGQVLRDDGRNFTIKCGNCGEVNFSRSYEKPQDWQRKPATYSFQDLQSKTRDVKETGTGDMREERRMGGDGRGYRSDTGSPVVAPFPSDHQGRPPPSYYQQTPPPYPWYPPPQPPQAYYPPVYGPHWQRPSGQRFRREISPVSLLIHGAMFLLLIILIMNFIALGPAFMAVARDSHSSPGIVWLRFLVPFPPFIVSLDGFLYDTYGINIFLGSYAIVVYFLLIELAVVLSYVYLFRKDGEDLLCQLYSGITGDDIRDASELPLIGGLFKPSDTPQERESPASHPLDEPARLDSGETELRYDQPQPPSLPRSQQQIPPSNAGLRYRFGDIARGGDSTWDGQTPWTRELQMPWESSPGALGEKPSFFSNSNNKFGSEDNAIILVLKMFMITIFVNALYIIITYSVFGESIETPEFLEEMKFWELAFGLARASVYEEIEARVILLGLPLYFCHRYFNKEAFRKTEGLKRYLFGGDIEIDASTVVFLLFSSVVFGLAHLGGWNVYKVVPTAIGGILLGYLFLKKGLPASILLHFLIDYLSMPYQFYNPFYTILVFANITAFISIFAGMVLTVYYLVRLSKWWPGFWEDIGKS